MRLFSAEELAWGKEGGRHGYQRPVEISWQTRAAEAWLCRRNRWRYDIFTGKVPVTSRGASGAFHVRNATPLLFQWKPKVSALRVTEWLRFGNAVGQLRNVFHIAERWGISKIEFTQPHPFFRGDRAGGIDLFWGVESTAPPVPTLEGHFFFLRAFRRRSPRSISFAPIAAKYLRPIVAPEIATPDPRVGDDDLVLHFRAGDIFSTTRLPHPHYGQPPLSYYLSVVDRERPARVWLTFEDRGNPCVDAADAALRARGISVLTQSATLAEDIRLLMSARKLVCGRGSFAYTIAHLSARLRRIYFFEWNAGGSLALHRGVEAILATDAIGEFRAQTLRRNWKASEQQRALMLSYPGENLRFERIESQSRGIQR